MEQDAKELFARYADMIYRIAMSYGNSVPFAEDMVQEVFVRYLKKRPGFENSVHEKAWFIRVTLNSCKDLLKSLFRKRTVPLELLAEESASVLPENLEVIEAVLALPERYKLVIYLHYYEGYTAKEIGKLLNKKENTIYSLLSRGREQLKLELGGDSIEE